ncbi:MAG: AAA family ATPase [Bacteroidales bacterium]|nr:AAA family ATPase [Bacteroidales bacterium]
MGVDGFFENKLVSNLEFEPTEDQKHLFKVLSEFVTLNDNSDIMVVTGYAGTGKTSAIAAFVKTLKQFEYKFVLLAPTGRSAKVLSGFTGERALTIHKHIYRQKAFNSALGQFTLDINKSRDTFYIVDEASLITIDSSSGSAFGSGDLLDDLIRYVRSNTGNNLILVGDRGQLPPIGMSASPALDLDYLSEYGEIMNASLSQVVRQASESGILYNATKIRNIITKYEDNLANCPLPQLEVDRFPDIERIGGGELIEKLSEAYDKYGNDNVVVLCRSNKRANRYNQGIRNSVLFREEKINKGDKLMVVKNCYQFLDEVEDGSFFIANGDVAELQKISRYEQRYGFTFAEARLSFPDYNDMEIVAKVILDTLDSESASLTAEQQKAIFDGVYEDYSDIKTKKKRFEAVREDKYFNALQIKYAAAITCHKSQGGAWPCVFIDNPFWGDEICVEDLKWLYTAITRAVDKVFLVNFKADFFKTLKI